MNNEEAKALFEQDLKDGKCSDDCPECNAIELAIYALEKQIPKKPLPDKRYFGVGKCSVCGVVFFNKSLITPFCGNCGQSLDWGDIK